MKESFANVLQRISPEDQVMWVAVFVIIGITRLGFLAYKYWLIKQTIDRSALVRLRNAKRVVSRQDRKLYQQAIDEEAFRHNFGCYKSASIRSAIAGLDLSKSDWLLLKTGISDITVNDKGKLKVDLPFWKWIFLIFTAFISVFMYSFGTLLVLTNTTPMLTMLGFVVMASAFAIVSPLSSAISAYRFLKKYK